MYGSRHSILEKPECFILDWHYLLEVNLSLAEIITFFWFPERITKLNFYIEIEQNCESVLKYKK